MLTGPLQNKIGVYATILIVSREKWEPQRFAESARDRVAAGGNMYTI